MICCQCFQVLQVCDGCVRCLALQQPPWLVDVWHQLPQQGLCLAQLLPEWPASLPVQALHENVQEGQEAVLHVPVCLW